MPVPECRPITDDVFLNAPFGCRGCPGPSKARRRRARRSKVQWRTGTTATMGTGTCRHWRRLSRQRWPCDRDSRQQLLLLSPLLLPRRGQCSSHRRYCRITSTSSQHHRDRRRQGLLPACRVPLPTCATAAGCSKACGSLRRDPHKTGVCSPIRSSTAGQLVGV